MIKNRGETIDVTDQVNLTIQIKDSNGDPVDTDSVPKISIIQPSGLVLLTPTSSGVARVAVGKYSYVFTVPINGPYGVFQDVWTGFVNGFRIEMSFSFVVLHTQVPAINTDGYAHLGDDPGFNYSQNAIKNINKLIKSLKARLNSWGKAKSKDSFGNTIYVDCDIFTVDQLVTFLATALWDFNQVPYFTYFTFDDDAFVDQFGEILVEGATIQGLLSKALTERGREYNISDNGLSFTPPGMSDMLKGQADAMLTVYTSKLQTIKNSLRPFPKGLGTFSMSSGANPAFARMRHLRQGRRF